MLLRMVSCWVLYHSLLYASPLRVFAPSSSLPLLCMPVPLYVTRLLVGLRVGVLSCSPSTGIPLTRMLLCLPPASFSPSTRALWVLLPSTCSSSTVLALWVFVLYHFSCVLSLYGGWSFSGSRGGMDAGAGMREHAMFYDTREKRM
jgi:hypothetical protein